MSRPQCDEIRLALGALALGVLEPAEEQQVREHLAECPDCAAEAESLAGTVAALALVDLPAVEDPAVRPSPDLLPRLLAQVRRARLRQRVVGLAAAAAVVVAAGFGGFGLADREEVAAPPEQPAASATGQEQGVALEVVVWDRGWGTAVQAKVSGVPGGSRCSLVAVGADGTREVGATWVVPAAGYEGIGTLTVDGAVGLRSWDIEAYEIVTLDGQTLVTTEG